MKLSKEIFSKLNEEKKKADALAFNVDVAIQSLQNICEHQWETQFLVDQYETPCCTICGLEQEVRPGVVFVNDSNEGLRKAFEEIYNMLKTKGIELD